MNDFAAFIYGFQFHYDLILLLHGFMLPLMKLYFNFIMILFYFFFNLKDVYNVLLFQFHYDLILFWLIINNNYFYQIFQFHYDLILFFEKIVFIKRGTVISISLWSYSIRSNHDTQYILGKNFNFIMILFYL